MVRAAEGCRPYDNTAGFDPRAAECRPYERRVARRATPTFCGFSVLIRISLSIRKVKYNTGVIEFGNKIKELRKIKGITQQELSTVLGVSLGAIGMYETNRARPSHEILKKIAEYFDISMNELYDME